MEPSDELLPSHHALVEIWWVGRVIGVVIRLAIGGLALAVSREEVAPVVLQVVSGVAAYGEFLHDFVQAELELRRLVLDLGHGRLRPPGALRPHALIGTDEP